VYFVYFVVIKSGTSGYGRTISGFKAPA
jgi:hypothetical protein